MDLHLFCIKAHPILRRGTDDILLILNVPVCDNRDREVRNYREEHIDLVQQRCHPCSFVPCTNDGLGQPDSNATEVVTSAADHTRRWEMFAQPLDQSFVDVLVEEIERAQCGHVVDQHQYVFPLVDAERKRLASSDQWRIRQGVAFVFGQRSATQGKTANAHVRSLRPRQNCSAMGKCSERQVRCARKRDRWRLD